MRVTDIIANTYYARVHVARPAGSDGAPAHDADVDGRPSDAINLAVRFGAPVYVHRKIVESAAAVTQEQLVPSTESHAGVLLTSRAAASPPACAARC